MSKIIYLKFVFILVMRNVSPTFMKSVEEGAKLDSVADANKNIDNTDDYDDLQVQFMLPLLEEGKDENESESDDGYHDLEYASFDIFIYFIEEY